MFDLWPPVETFAAVPLFVAFMLLLEDLTGVSQQPREVMNHFVHLLSALAVFFVL